MTATADVQTQTEGTTQQLQPLGSLCFLPWPPCLLVAYYLDLPNIHYHLWNIPLNSPHVKAHLFIEDLAQVPWSALSGRYCTNKITHKTLTMFNQVLCGLE